MNEKNISRQTEQEQMEWWANFDISWIDEFIANIKDVIFVRPEDDLLIIMPNQAYPLNESGVKILDYLMTGKSIKAYLERIGDLPGHRRDLHYFFCDLRALLNGCVNECGNERRATEFMPFTEGFNRLPVLSEIAVTYKCNLSCSFCYAGCGCKADEGFTEITTDEVKRVLDIIYKTARVPSVSFTGGEPTLRPDLCELIAYARGLGMRVNLITNGTLIDKYLAGQLKDAGLNSAQVSLEGHSPEIHDALTGRPGSFYKTVTGLRALKEEDIHVHTNTTLNSENCEHIEDLVDCLADLGMSRMSMNLVIPTGSASEAEDGHRDVRLSYTDAGAAILRARKKAEDRNIKYLWYSPIPYCIFNPVAEGLGNKSCAACDGLLSIAPNGDVLPCSSYAEPVGNILAEPFEDIWFSDMAEYFKKIQYAPDECTSCQDLNVCKAACPLYWNEFGSGELEGKVACH
jgi:radical SAM protein with 4Fe4S-binding SPASM domain